MTVSRFARRFLLSLTTVAVLASTLAVTTASAGRAKKMGKPVTVQGTLIDTKCYLMNSSNSGNDHITPKGKMPSCAAACASMGIPVGVLTAKGDVVVVVAPANLFAPHMAKSIKVTGMSAMKGNAIIAKEVSVRTDGRWENVEIATMM